MDQDLNNFRDKAERIGYDYYFNKQATGVTIIEPLFTTIDALEKHLALLCGMGKEIEFPVEEQVKWFAYWGNDIAHNRSATMPEFHRKCLMAARYICGYENGSPKITPSKSPLITFAMHQYTADKVRLSLTIHQSIPGMVDFRQTIIDEIAKLYPEAKIYCKERSTPEDTTPATQSAQLEQSSFSPIPTKGRGERLTERSREKTLHASTAQPEAPKLTEREGEVLALVIEGLGRQEIAAKLMITPSTIDTHVQNICRKRALPKVVKSASKLRLLINQSG